MNLYEEICGKYVMRFGEKIKPQKVFRGEMTWIVDQEILLDLMQSLKLQDKFNYLVDITSVDHLGSEPRFEVVYELCSLENAVHLRLKVWVDEKCELPSVFSIWKTADWHEREIFDMMGIRFKNHPDLRRILMWDDYPFHPLRKDFPLEGKPSLLPDVAFTKISPMEGGPFVTRSGNILTTEREPRARPPENL